VRRPLVITAIDEAVLSAINFGISIAFIRGGDKADFGVYTLIVGILLLMRGFQNAVIVTPLTTHGARQEPKARDRFIAAVERLQMVVGAAGSMLLLIALLVRGSKGALELAAAAALASIGTWLREFQRSVWLLEERNAQALAGDAVFATLTAVGITAWWRWRGTVTTTSVLFVIGIAALIPGMIGMAKRVSGQADPLRSTAAVLYEHGKWTLPGTAVIWGQNSGYAYLVSLMVDTSAVATLATARLFVMPVLLLLTAWGRIYVPRAGTLIAQRATGEVRRLALRGIVMLLALSLPYFVGLAAFFALGGMALLSAKYQGIGPYVALWSGFAAIAVVRSAASNALLAYQAFRDLFSFAIVAAVVSLALVVALIPVAGIGGAVAGLVTGELILVVLSWRRLDRER
jgi:O-antigen/teichoic acid export membrane protein